MATSRASDLGEQMRKTVSSTVFARVRNLDVAKSKTAGGPTKASPLRTATSHEASLLLCQPIRFRITKLTTTTAAATDMGTTKVGVTSVAPMTLIVIVTIYVVKN